jgi:hypothetical protein
MGFVEASRAHLRIPGGREFGSEFCPLGCRFDRIEAFLHYAFNVLWQIPCAIVAANFVVNRREFCLAVRSPHGAQRNAGMAVPAARPLPDYAALHPGYKASNHRS